MAIAVSRARTALATAAALAVVATGFAGCSTQPETIRSYTPANGANVDAGSVKARGLALVTSGGPALLAGALTSGDGDRLTGVDGTALDATGNPAAKLTASVADKVSVPAGALVQLPQQGILLDGKGLTPGATARVTLTFEKAGSLVALVPVVSSEHPDWAGITPKPGDVARTASLAASPSSGRSATPSAPASATPSATASK